MPILFRKTRRAIQETQQVQTTRSTELEREATRQAEEARVLKDREERLAQLLASRVDTYPHIAKAWADWELAIKLRMRRATFGTKRHPAPTAADAVQAKGGELAAARRQAKLAEYICALYEWHVPWLVELRDMDVELDYAKQQVEPDRQDPVAGYLSKEEWSRLPE